MIKYLVLLGMLFTLGLDAQNLRIAKLKYDGGGDWYANKTALPNLIQFCNRNLKYLTPQRGGYR